MAIIRKIRVKFPGIEGIKLYYFPSVISKIKLDVMTNKRGINPDKLV